MTAALDPQAAAVLEQIRRSPYPAMWEMSPAEARRFHDEQAPKTNVAPEPMHAISTVTVPGPGAPLAVRLYRPRPDPGPEPLLVWLHGGGHTVGSLDSYDALCRRIAAEAGCVVGAVDYRLAPEHPFPAAVEDTRAALEGLLERAVDLGVDPRRVAVGGDSAGGNLAAVAALIARDAGGPSLALQVLVYPATAGHVDFDSHRRFGEDYLLTRRDIAWFRHHYCPDPALRRDWRFAPLEAPRLEGLPPALVIVAGHDPLHDEGVAYARRLEDAGNRVCISAYPGAIHAFLSLAGLIDAGRHAMVEIGQALRAAFDTTENAP